MSAPIAHAPSSPKQGQVLRETAVEAAEWIARHCRRLPKSTIRESAAVLARQKTLLRIGGSADQARDIARSIEAISETRPLNRDVIDALTESVRSGVSPSDLAAIAKRYPYRIKPLARSFAEWPNKSAIVRALGDGAVTETCADFTFRGLSGRKLSRNQIRLIVEEWRTIRPDIPGVIAGEVFEAVASSQISRGTMAGRIPLAKNARLVPAKYSGSKGIDAIAAQANGAPTVFEFTISPRKSAGLTNDVSQLSYDGIAFRYNEFLKTPTGAAQLRDAGITERFLSPVSAEDVRAFFSRKLVVDNPESLSELGRMRWNLGADDMLALNQ